MRRFNLHRVLTVWVGFACLATAELAGIGIFDSDPAQIVTRVLRNLFATFEIRSLHASENTATDDVVIRFAGSSDGTAAACDTEASAPAGWKVRDLRFFVHDLRLVGENGEEVPVDLVDDGSWQGSGVALLDLQEDCGRVGNEVRRIVVGTVPLDPESTRRRWRGLRFRVGVPFALNHQDPAHALGPLARTSMHWNWRAGYKFLRFSAEEAGEDRWRLHLGSTGCEGLVGAIEKCRYPSRPEVVLPGLDVETDTVVFDPALLFAVLDAIPRQDRPTKCMGVPSAPGCRPVFPVLGLDEQGNTVRPAAIFRRHRGEQERAEAEQRRTRLPDLRQAPPEQGTAWLPTLPAHIPVPRVKPEEVPTPGRIRLGRHLFYDRRLSGDESMSCSTCHRQELAFTDGRAQSHGITFEIVPRNAMSLANVVFASRLTWANPYLERLEHQARIPLFGDDPVEMGMGDREDELLDRLRSDPLYQELFVAAFPTAKNPITVENLLAALAAFERTLISVDAPFDRWMAGDSEAVSESAKRGYQLFLSERLECFHCHGGPLFTDSLTHQGLPTGEVAFHNTGLYNVDGKGSYPSEDTGLRELTLWPADMGRFRAPTLRNIELTAPYMHDGSMATIEEVIGHYEDGGRTIPHGPNAGSGAANPNKSEFVLGFLLEEDERADLIAFLHSLTDETFITNPRFRDPWIESQ